MFGNLKNRLRKKDYDDVEDIRSSVLGDFKGLPPQPEPDFPRRAPQEVPTWDDPATSQRFDEPPGFSSIDVREPIGQRGFQQPSRDYDIMDRLSLIESQLSAIRSQTETINERLKNMERSMGRRY